jgi:hypothetical protein
VSSIFGPVLVAIARRQSFATFAKMVGIVTVNLTR